jgi:hypothetical protein
VDFNRFRFSRRILKKCFYWKLRFSMDEKQNIGSGPTIFLKEKIVIDFHKAGYIPKSGAQY